MKAITCFFVALALTGEVAAQTQRVPVEILHAGEDTAGRQLAFELREVIRGSQGMRLVTEGEAETRIVLHLASVDSSTTSPGSGTSMSVAITVDSRTIDMRGLYLTVVQQVCGLNRLQSCARGLAGNIDSQLEFIRKNWPTYWRLLQAK